MTRTRMTASERGEQVLDAAVSAFAESGYAATKTDEIARRSGVSQPYVIRLFGSKQQLFLAATLHVCGRIEDIFRTSVAAAAPDADTHAKLDAMGDGYRVFLTERDLPVVLMHGMAASNDPVIGDAVRERYGRMYFLIRELTGASPLQARNFMATGMLLTMMAAMRVIGPDAVPADWAQEIMDNLEETEGC
ncbi:TetR/AcrR family transcriptional regulator [Nocardia huaxiensis]|uniref:TetR/AcrR family transcriptional regulator n=1 Tax=Nocardia huaxiensis TaxID=2755382 RepID=A0A7D6VEV3_9NOCA|nr:TetR/AcrR family transcriptional regulator [Nocardia huaxiensis]QLY33814.1 TetR/AcrR family transcriptional regulator [Nocardia huaxiensis]UFS99261.1 TetR/AcrR family transcriptional regulator [Nocardia huaxiensis]